MHRTTHRTSLLTASLATAALLCTSCAAPVAGDAYGTASGLDALTELIGAHEFGPVLSRSFAIILDDEHLATYERLDHSKRALYRRRFWLKNDPTPATDTNEFLEEHLLRLSYTLEHFCPADRLLWDGRGDAALRFGIPPSRQCIIGGVSVVSGARGIMPNSEIWTYPRLDMVLHFVAPNADGRYVAGFDVKYTTARLLPHEYPTLGTLHISPGAPTGGSFGRLDPMIAKGMKATEEVAVSYGYRPPTAPMTLFYEIVTARGAGGATDIAVNYAVPMADLSFGEDGTMSEVTLAKQVRILNEERDVLTSDARLILVSRDSSLSTDGSDLITDEWRVDAAPGTYIVEVSAEDTLTGRACHGRSRIEVPDYSGSELMMSDLQLAASVGAGGRFTRMGGAVVPRPSHAFTVAEEMTVYFELYGLLEDAPGRSRFTVVTEVSGRLYEEKKSGLAAFFSGLFPKQRHAVSSRVLGSGDAPDTAYWYALSLDDLPEDNYELVVTVKDVRSGRQVSKMTAFTVLEP